MEEKHHGGILISEDILWKEDLNKCWYHGKATKSSWGGICLAVVNLYKKYFSMYNAPFLLRMSCETRGGERYTRVELEELCYICYRSFFIRVDQTSHRKNANLILFLKCKWETIISNSYSWWKILLALKFKLGQIISWKIPNPAWILYKKLFISQHLRCTYEHPYFDDSRANPGGGSCLCCLTNFNPSCLLLISCLT